MAYNKPEDPFEYMENCIKKLKEKDLTTVKTRVRWNAFLPPAPSVESNYVASNQTGIFKRENNVIPPIHQFKRKVIENPVLRPALPAIKPLEQTKKSKAWQNIVFVLGGPGSGTYDFLFIFFCRKRDAM
jgi:hypothetical protein